MSTPRSQTRMDIYVTPARRALLVEARRRWPGASASSILWASLHYVLTHKTGTFDPRHPPKGETA